VERLIEDREVLHLGEGYAPVAVLGEKLQQLLKGRRVSRRFGAAANERTAADGERAAEHHAGGERSPHASAPQKS
jgi:hypothetical protein